MSTDDTHGADRAGEARKSLLDSVAGKAKEVAGAVTGKGDLTEEGQLQQAGAKARKQANADEAVADAKARTAAKELQDRTDAAAQDKHAAYAQAARQEDAALNTAAAEKATADARAEQQELSDRRAAEAKADTIARDSENAAIRLAEQAKHTEDAAHETQAGLNADAADAELRAQQLRAEADSE